MAGPPGTRLTRAEGRRFALSVGGAFLGLGALVAWRGGTSPGIALAALGLGLGLAGVLVPTRLGPVERAWMALARAISRVTTPVVLAVVYFGSIVPIGLVMRALGRNPIRHQPRDGSYWQPRDRARGSLRNQF